MKADAKTLLLLSSMAEFIVPVLQGHMLQKVLVLYVLIDVIPAYKVLA